MREPLTLETISTAELKLGHWWYQFYEWDFTILAPPKCGSTAIKQFIHVNEISVSSLRQYQVRGDCYFVTRDPLDRFRSLWSLCDWSFMLPDHPARNGVGNLAARQPGSAKPDGRDRDARRRRAIDQQQIHRVTQARRRRIESSISS